MCIFDLRMHRRVAKMMKSSWIIFAVLFAAISAPKAHADTFTYSYFSGELGCGTNPATCAVYSWTTLPIAAVTSETTLPATDLTAFSLTGTLAGCTLSAVTLDLAGAGDQGFTSTNCGSGSNPDGFPVADYSTPGIYSFLSVTVGVNDSLVVTAIPSPEPSTVFLMLLGLGLAFVMRKHIGQGHPQAA
jgi:hypothetical protein